MELRGLNRLLFRFVLLFGVTVLLWLGAAVSLAAQERDDRALRPARWSPGHVSATFRIDWQRGFFAAGGARVPPVELQMPMFLMSEALLEGQLSEELGLDPISQARLRSRVLDLRATYNRVADFITPEGMGDEVLELSEAAQRLIDELDDVLVLPRQRERLKQLAYQHVFRQYGPLAALLDGVLGSELEITGDQRQALLNRAADAVDRLAEASAEISEAATDQLKRVFTEEQRLSLEDRIGDAPYGFLAPEVIAWQLLYRPGLLEREGSIYWRFDNFGHLRLDAFGNLVAISNLAAPSSAGRASWVNILDSPIAAEMGFDPRITYELLRESRTRMHREAAEARTGLRGVEALRAMIEAHRRVEAEFEEHLATMLASEGIELFRSLQARMRVAQMGLICEVLDGSLRDVVELSPRQRDELLDHARRVRDQLIQHSRRVEQEILDELLAELTDDQRRKLNELLGPPPRASLPRLGVLAFQLQYVPSPHD